MNRAEFLELIRNGENSGVEFKRDGIRPEQLAKEMAALLNFEGGHILLGVDDDGSVPGLARSREEVERWVMDIAHQNIQPSVIPSWSSVTLDDGGVVGVIRLQADSPDKPHKAKRGSAWVTFVRVGSTSREARREEEGRLYQAAHLMRYDIRPVLDTGFESIDQARLENYFRVVLKRDAPTRDDRESWRRTLVNVDILADAAGITVATVAGLLLFGENPNRRLPQAGITATAFPREEKDYDTVDEELIRGPLVSMLSPRKRAVDKGVIDRAVDFVVRNMGTVAWLEGGRRRREKGAPGRCGSGIHSECGRAPRLHPDWHRRRSLFVSGPPRSDLARSTSQRRHRRKDERGTARCQERTGEGSPARLWLRGPPRHGCAKPDHRFYA